MLAEVQQRMKHPDFNDRAGRTLRELRDGNRRFVSGTARLDGLGKATVRRTAYVGNRPGAVVLSGADSRVPVERIFDAPIGQIYSVRVIANVTSEDATASIEHAVQNLRTPLLVVLGHTRCTLIRDVLEGTPLRSRALQQLAAPLREIAATTERTHSTLEERVHTACINNVWRSVEDLLTHSGAVSEEVRNDHLLVVGALYDIETGDVTWLGQHPAQARLIGMRDAAPPADH